MDYPSFTSIEEDLITMTYLEIYHYANRKITVKPSFQVFSVLLSTAIILDTNMDISFGNYVIYLSSNLQLFMGTIFLLGFHSQEQEVCNEAAWRQICRRKQGVYLDFSSLSV